MSDNMSIPQCYKRQFKKFENVYKFEHFSAVEIVFFSLLHKYLNTFC